MKKNNTPLVSICIPTYNRAGILDQILSAIVPLKEFDDDIELVISDNCSDDNTKEVVSKFLGTFPSKRIIYNRNEKNIRDRNFLKVLSLGTGRYLKLQNDYLPLSDYDLKVYKEFVKKTPETENLFFYDELRANVNVGKGIYINNIDKFVRVVNNKVTWIANFGCWKKDLPYIQHFETKSGMLLQMEWTLALAKNTASNIVRMSYGKQIKRNEKTKISYNFFSIHIVEYYRILQSYVESGDIRRSSIKYDKYRVLSNYIGYTIVDYLIYKKETSLDLSGSWSVVWHYFARTPYLYWLFLKAPFRYIWLRMRHLY